VSPLFSDYSLRRGKNLFLDLTVFSMLPLATNSTVKRLAQPACLLLGLMFFLRTVRLHKEAPVARAISAALHSSALLRWVATRGVFLLPLFPART